MPEAEQSPTLVRTDTGEVVEPLISPQIFGFKTSITIGKIALSLAKAQAQFAKVTKDTQNPFYKSRYADLATVIDATRKPLSDNGIAVIQSPQLDHVNRLIVVTTMLVHSSGEWIAGDLALPFGSKYDPQGAGSGITYARRYARQAFLDVAAEDDDGNAAVVAQRESELESKHEELEPKMRQQERIAAFQVKALFDACKASGKGEAIITAHLSEHGYVQFEEVKKFEFNDFLKWANQKPKEPSDLTEPLKKSVEAASQPNLPRLFAIANKKQVSNDDLHQYAKERFGVTSLKDLKKNDFNDMVSWLESLA